jgi:formylglycine-generating enzyme required for sulfatase activity
MAGGHPPWVLTAATQTPSLQAYGGSSNIMLQPNQTLGSYRVIRFLGAGGMGAVYEAQHVRRGSRHALKVLGHQYLHSPAVRDRFKREAHLMAALGGHPSIVKATEVIDTPENVALVLELVTGGDLGAALERRPGPLPWPEAWRILKPVVSAMTHAHAQRVVHRDLKPENVLLRPDGTWAGEPLVTDFGIAKVLGADSATRTQSRMGTTGYGAPEQFKNAKEVGPEADVWALAMLTWRLVMGRLPIDPDDNMAVIRLYEGLEAVPPLVGVPDTVRHAVMAAFSVDPKNRPRDAGVFGKLLAVDTVETAAPGGAAWGPPTEPAEGEMVAVRRDTEPVERKTEPSAAPKGVPTPTGAAPRTRRLLLGAGVALVTVLVTLVMFRSKGLRTEIPVPGAQQSPAKKTRADVVQASPAPSCPTLAEADAARLRGDEPKARGALEAACEAGCGRGCVDLAVMLHGARGGDGDVKRAEGLVEKHFAAAETACSAGSGPDCLAAGLVQAGGIGEAQDAAAAVRSFERGCEAGSGMACRELGLMWSEGRGVTKDEGRSVTPNDKACRAGLRDACERLGGLLAREVVGPRDGRRANLLEAACDGGVIDSCHELGLRYAAGGDGLRQDAARAAQMLEKPCSAGRAGACLQLGLLVEAGRGVPRDGARAVSLLRQAGFVHVAAGSFMMGSPASEAGREQDEREHAVTLTRGVWFRTTEVTQGEWQSVMGNNPSEFKACGETCPVEGVSWTEATTFLNRLSERAGLEPCYDGARFKGLTCAGYRLPTEAEWEYAARAGEAGPLYGEVDVIAWHEGNAGRTTRPVGTRQANALGLHDMLGNVWEWTQDWYGSYGATARDPTGPGSGSSRVIRGGGWDVPPASLRMAYRAGFAPSERGNFIGLRIARTSAFAGRP